jgi:hypothetical protein
MEKTQVEVDRIAAENPGQNRLSGLKQGRIWDGANLESYNGPVRLDLGQGNAIEAILSWGDIARPDLGRPGPRRTRLSSGRARLRYWAEVTPVLG